MLATAFPQRARINRREADLLYELRHDALGLRVVTRNEEHEAVVSGCVELSLRSECLLVHGVERLDDACPGETASHQLARREAVEVDLAVSPFVIVHGVHYYLACELV